jgi:hypothetical protein
VKSIKLRAKLFFGLTDGFGGKICDDHLAGLGKCCGVE